MIGWITDFFRFLWALLYWNTRKSIYRLRLKRGRAHCPCQHPSDSGRALETGCTAMLHWNQPARFQRVCPLLKQIPSGAWRCSVNRADVRPFWGRVLGIYGGGALGIYILAALSVFILLRTVGYQVTYPGVLWPPAWKQFTPIRATFFLKKYANSTAAGDMKAAIMALSTAYNLDPNNYVAGRQLAQFWQVTQPALSDRIYQQLVNTHPSEAEDIAQAWYRALLARGDFASIEKLAAARIIAAPDRSSAWLNAFLFANQRTIGTDTRTTLLESAEISPGARFLLNLSDDLRKLPRTAARARLLRAADEARDGLSLFHICRQLTLRNLAQDALDVLDQRAGLLGARDSIALRLDALASLRMSAALQRDVRSLLASPPNPVVWELLSAHLIRYPDPAIFELVFGTLQSNPPPSAIENYPALLSLFCAAGANKSEARMAWSIGRIRALIGNNLVVLESIGKSLIDHSGNQHIENQLPALQPLPLDVSYALFDHYSPTPP